MKPWKWNDSFLFAWLSVWCWPPGVSLASHTAGLQPTQGTRVFPKKPQKDSVPALSNKAIEKAIAGELQMTASEQKETSYYYHYVDLNDDGITDAWFLP